jgi:hypothetical protein
MNLRAQMVCAWCGLAFALLFLVGLWPIANFMPPLAPSLSAEAIAAIYQQNTLPIRFGTLLLLACSGLMCPFVAVIALQMRRIEGDRFPILTMTQISAGTLNVMFFILPAVIWTAAAFRPERDPELTRLLNDLGWIAFLMPFTTFIVQNFALGFTILGDKRPRPVFPRWLGFFNFWVAVLFIPGGLLTFFKIGPFAWNGLFVWWIPFLVFFTWYLLMFYMLRIAVIEQGKEADTATT